MAAGSGLVKGCVNFWTLGCLGRTGINLSQASPLWAVLEGLGSQAFLFTRGISSEMGIIHHGLAHIITSSEKGIHGQSHIITLAQKQVAKITRLQAQKNELFIMATVTPLLAQK